ncbi:MAG: site-2 protease family protein [Peptostreptococcaceae bacterium]|nr:site-2 protease family protein [Peptostreptococcaceae bacterium]MDY5738918.1 site-2 protease family protein [Anaerovoracaceae bacterium]
MNRRNISPIMIIIFVMIVVNMIGGRFSNPLDWLQHKILLLPAIVIGLTFHEAAHGFVSYKLGDPTPKNQGRLTLDPRAHMDPFGFLALIFAGFGWGIPVQIDPRYYKHPRRDEFFVSIAGVTTNFIIALIAMIINTLLLMNNIVDSGSVVTQVLNYMVVINIILMCFNLLPIPPLDGFSILTQIFDLRKYSWYYSFYNKGFLLLMVFVLLGVTDNFLGKGVSLVYNFMLEITLRVIQAL